MSGWATFRIDPKNEFERHLHLTWLRMSGWAPEVKIRDMVKLTLDAKPKLHVELGLYAGRSFLPVAWALKQNGSGRAIGIDPYTNDACTEGWPADQDHTGWDTNPLEPYYQELMKTASDQDLLDFFEVWKKRSTDVVTRFEDESIDVLHVDGNHSELTSYRDVTEWLPKVKRGGYIWSDDAHMPTTKKAFDFLDRECELVKNYPDERAGHPSWFRLYRKK
jgi:hypothetical protein